MSDGSFDPDLGDSIRFDRDGYEVAGHDVYALSRSGDDIEALRDVGLTITRRTTLDGVGLELVRIHVPQDQSAEAALARLAAANSDTVFALNHLYSAGAISGPRGRVAGKAPDTSSNVRVGMLDGRVIDAVLPPGVQVESRRFATGGAMSGAGHGTAVATLLSRSGVGHIYAADVFAGRSASAEAIIEALDWMATQRVAVINVSLAGPPNLIIAKMIALLESRGHVIVAANGNDGPAAPPLYPAAYPDVISVTAVDAEDRIYRRANRGPWTVVAARGVDVETVDDSGAAREVSGTSFAAPIVSARLARMLGAPDLAGRKRAVDALVRSAKDLGPPGRDPIYGFGLVGDGPL